MSENNNLHTDVRSLPGFSAIHISGSGVGNRGMCYRDGFSGREAEFKQFAYRNPDGSVVVVLAIPTPDGGLDPSTGKAWTFDNVREETVATLPPASRMNWIHSSKFRSVTLLTDAEGRTGLRVVQTEPKHPEGRAFFFPTIMPAPVAEPVAAPVKAPSKGSAK